VKVLADTSAWIELLRRTGSPTALGMRRRLEADEIATTDVVIMEVLAGENDAARLTKAQRALDACTYLPQQRIVDARAAASIFRDCRQAGETPRQLADCLVAAIAIRSDAPVLHRDRDFTVIARHTKLRVLPS
jgi:predicted nucleic acid-binding protein